MSTSSTLSTPKRRQFTDLIYSQSSNSCMMCVCDSVVVFPSVTDNATAPLGNKGPESTREESLRAHARPPFAKSCAGDSRVAALHCQ
uniref:Uncharacterized protein n=1 Tax=Panagrellus redivivus TaxID=6233 RepID=A0A7E4VL26_PANRE